ncbi:MAG TPA: glycosyltransferase family 87 protein [Allosphingosinicella sp.]|jgi:hypothetical protein
MRLSSIDAGITALFNQGRAYPLQALGWAVSLYLSFLILGIDWSAAWRSHGDLAVRGSAVLGRDFANVFTGGTLVLQGKLETIYGLAAYQEYQTQLFADAVRYHNYSYTPISFLYVWAFGLLPYLPSYLLWTALTGAAFAWAARPYLRDVGLPGWLALLLPASLINVWAGHYGFLIGALWLGAWHLLDTRPRLAGLLIGLMVVKPHLAILIPLLLIRRRAWEPFATASMTVVVLALLSVFLFGTQPWVDFATKTVGLQASMVDDVERFFVLMMPTVAPSLFRAGLSPTLVWPLQAATAAAAIFALWRRMPDNPRQAGLAAACGTFLVLPYAFNYDMTVVGIASLCLLRGDHYRSGGRFGAVALVLCFLLPVLTLAMNRVGLPLAPVLIGYMFAVLLAPATGKAGVRPAPPASLPQAGPVRPGSSSRLPI